MLPLSSKQKGRSHGSSKVCLWCVGFVPGSIRKLVGLVIGKEGFDPLPSQIGRPEFSRRGTNGRVGQFEPRLATIFPTPTLQIANNHCPTRYMVGKVGKGRHDTNVFEACVSDPSAIGGEFYEIPNFGFDQIGNPAVGVMNRALVHHYLETLRTCTIPGFGT